MTAEAPVLEEALAPLLARPWLLVGVGCDLRGDDAFGPLLARRLTFDTSTVLGESSVTSSKSSRWSARAPRKWREIEAASLSSCASSRPRWATVSCTTFEPRRTDRTNVQ